MDDLYSSCLAVRSLPIGFFLSDEEPEWRLPITSINEDQLLKHLGLSGAERNQIEGLQLGARATDSNVGVSLTEDQLSSRAIVRLAANPPPEAGKLQRRTFQRLLRPFPLGLRFSGKNMSPLPCWLAGAQNVCLNMCNVDVPVQLHFALFNSSEGFVLKPLEMRSEPAENSSPVAPQAEGKGWNPVQRTVSSEMGTRPSELTRVSSVLVDNDDMYWPPPRDRLYHTAIELISLHNSPKVIIGRNFLASESARARARERERDECYIPFFAHR
eukprot:1236752-Prymnesium_polylepis.1